MKIDVTFLEDEQTYFRVFEHPERPEYQIRFYPIPPEELNWSATEAPF